MCVCAVCVLCVCCVCCDVGVIAISPTHEGMGERGRSNPCLRDRCMCHCSGRGAHWPVGQGLHGLSPWGGSSNFLGWEGQQDLYDRSRRSSVQRNHIEYSGLYLYLPFTSLLTIMLACLRFYPSSFSPSPSFFFYWHGVLFITSNSFIVAIVYHRIWNISCAHSQLKRVLNSMSGVKCLILL